MWLFVNNHSCFGYIQITTLNNKNTFGAPYITNNLKKNKCVNNYGFIADKKIGVL